MLVLGALASSRVGEGLLFVAAVAAVAGIVGFTVTSFEATVRACVAGVVEVGVVVSEVTLAATPLARSECLWRCACAQVQFRVFGGRAD